MVWSDGDIDLATCPVLHLTAEAKEVLAWFEQTHEMVANSGVLWWRMHTLPQAGGLDAQDARLMAGLEYMRDLHNALVLEDRKTRQKGEGDRGTSRRRRR